MRFIWLSLFAIVTFFSCSSDTGEEPSEMGVYDVDPEFEPYVEEFIEEAAKRGETIDFSDTGLTIRFSELALERANGRCFFNDHLVEIDKADWFSFSPSFRSYLLFHELGHCELRRGHTNNKFSDESWRSIMKGDPFDGIEIRNPVPFFGFRRDYYIDELFNSNLSEPSWARLDFNFNSDLPKEQIESSGETNRINSRPGLVDEDYEFEVNFDLMDAEGTNTFLEWGQNGSNYFIAIYPGFGFYAGVKDGGIDIFLHYRLNYARFNGAPISKITIRRHDGYEQLFVNEEQFFLLDPQERLDFISLSAMRGGQRVNNFEIQDFSLSRISQ